MDMSASTFSDPAMRASLQQYYEDKKAAAVAAWKARPEMPDEVTIQTPDGQTHTAKMIPISAEQMEKALVSFDKWLEIMAEDFGRTSTSLEMAQSRIAQLEENNPSNSSTVQATFADKGTLLAYINEDGTLVTSNGAEDYLGGISETADSLGLSGQRRVDYLTRKVKEALADRYPRLDVQSYTAATSPSLRDFANQWYNNYDADAIYTDAMADAKAQLDDVTAWHTRWQNNMYDIQGYLMKLQQQQPAA